MIQGNGGHAKVIRSFADWDAVLVAIGDNATRKSEVDRLWAEGWQFTIAVHPRAVVSHLATLDHGTVVMAGAVVQPGARIGRHVILNTNCSVDHNCLIEDYAHISPGAVLCGAVHVGEGAQIGAGAVCVQGAKVPPWTLVKAGTVFKSADWLENCQKLCK